MRFSPACCRKKTGKRNAPKQTWRHTFKAWTFCGQASGHSYALAEGGFRDTRDHVDQKGAASGTRADVVLSQTLHPAELGVYLATEYIVEAFEAPVQPHQATALEIEFNKPGRVRSPLSIANLEPKAARRASAHQVR